MNTLNYSHYESRIQAYGDNEGLHQDYIEEAIDVFAQAIARGVSPEGAVDVSCSLASKRAILDESFAIFDEVA